MTRFRRMFIIVGIMLLALTGFAVSVSAASISGQCGDNIYYTYDLDTCELKITGTGDMTEYTENNLPPWCEFSNEIKIVAIGEDIQASILTTLILKELGVPQITVKAQNDYHEKVLKKIGADKVVHPERDMGIRIANNMLSTNVLDYLELSDEHSIMELKAVDKVIGKTLIELDIRAKYNINIAGIKRGEQIIVSPDPNDPIEAGDLLIVIGADVDINRFMKKMM